MLGKLRCALNQSLSCAAVRQEVQKLEIQYLQLRPGIGGPGYGGPEAEGSEAGGPGAGASGRGAGRVLEVVDKTRVTLSSLELRDREAPAENECIQCIVCNFWSSCHL